MTAIRSHLTPDNIEGVKVGDEVYFHVTNLEQDWDVPHGFAIKGANNAEILIMPGETQTLKWVADRAGIFPFYCTDFCSALHQEMSGYLRVSPAGSNVALHFSTGTNKPAVTCRYSKNKWQVFLKIKRSMICKSIHFEHVSGTSQVPDAF